MKMYTFGTWKGVNRRALGIESGLPAPKPEAGPLGYPGLALPYVSYKLQIASNFIEFIDFSWISWNSWNFKFHSFLEILHSIYNLMESIASHRVLWFFNENKSFSDVSQNCCLIFSVNSIAVIFTQLQYSVQFKNLVL